MTGVVLTEESALAALGLVSGADARTIKAAFREAAKRAHPDAGGSTEAFARVRLAYEWLRGDPPPPAARPARPATSGQPPLTLTPLQALKGGPVEARIDGKPVTLALEPGLREGDGVNFDGRLLRVTIPVAGGVRVHGDDLLMTLEAPAFGGRVALQTPQGKRMIWIGPDDLRRGVVRIPGEGLPAAGRYGAGDLVVSLKIESGDESLAGRRKDFMANWA